MLEMFHVKQFLISAFWYRCLLSWMLRACGMFHVKHFLLFAPLLVLGIRGIVRGRGGEGFGELSG